MIKQLTDRVYYTPHEEAGDRPLLGYIRGDRYRLMIDAGNGLGHVQAFFASLKAAALPQPDFVALTHWHWDHTFGLTALACPSFATTQTNAYLADVMRWTWDDASMARRLETGADIQFCDEHIRIAYPDRAAIRVRQADITYTDRLTLDLGGVTCDLMQFENPHSADGVIALVPEEGALFLGDAAYQGMHHGREGLYEAKLRAFLQRVQGLSFRHALPGHEPPTEKEPLLREWREELARLAEAGEDRAP